MNRPYIAGNIARVRSLFARSRARAVLVYFAVAALLVIAIALGGNQIEHHIDAIEVGIARLGAWGVLAFVGLFVLTTSLLIPDTVLSVLAGALFGLRWGSVAVVTGGVLAAVLQYALSQRFLSGRIERMLAARPSLSAIQRAVRRSEVRLQVLLRLTPMNPATMSYVFGAAGVRFAGFVSAFLASIPHLIVGVYFGYAGRQVARLPSQPTGALHLREAALIGGLAATLVALVFVSRMARRAVMEAVSGTADAELGSPPE